MGASRWALRSSIAIAALVSQWPDGQPAAAAVPGDPRGRFVQGVFESSVIFPGTRREWSVYVPAEYSGAEPARLMVFQDGPAYAKADGPSSSGSSKRARSPHNAP